MKNEKLIIHGKFQSILSLAKKMEKTHKSFGTGEMISHSEIHLIEIIGDTQDLSVTDLSRHMGITKGAVSQSLKRLEKKGFTTKQTDPENLSRTIVMLTSKGQTAYWSHKHWHETMDGGFLKYLDELDDESFEIILDFLVKVESFYKLRLDSEG
jgi:DNA-binding MarR family transcriptional regulator